MSKILLAYVAGPFSAPDRAGVERNINVAVQVGLELAAAGLFPVVPHSNTSHPLYEAVRDYAFWIEGTTELLRRCDIVVTVHGWHTSKGASGEVTVARNLTMPVFHHIHEAATYATERQSR